MFTGIIEEIGLILSMKEMKEMKLWNGNSGVGYELVVKCNVCLKNAYNGCSIAVNGTCLTVTKFDKNSCTFGCSPET